MSREAMNRVSGRVAFALSMIALLTVVSGYFQPPPIDEGSAAHIFQIAVAAFVLLVPISVSTANWHRPLRSARPVMMSGAALTLAFGAFDYLEHYR